MANPRSRPLHVKDAAAEPTVELTYEAKAANLARSLIQQLCQHVPELRSAVVIFEWQDRLNEVSVPAVFWTANGQPDATDPLYVAALLAQFGRVMQMQSHLAANCVGSMTETIMSAREQMIHESEFTDAEKEALLASLVRTGN